jgi:formylglycine-generating enzyme required for sulfatase activity
VAGGSYDRTYESVDGGATGLSDPASVSTLRLDKYLVTVGRFRQFVEAWNDGNATPAAGSGKHAHLNGNQGLVNAGVSGSVAYETGWASSDDDSIDPTDFNLTGCVIDEDGSTVTFSTWTPSPEGQDTLPINCVNWYEAYAFCIWDGGFLPSEAEWEYAAAAGSQQQQYPWGSTDPGDSSDYAIYGCNYPLGSDGVCTTIASIAPVGAAPAGAGAWGQLDLAGEVFEWTMDDYSAYVDPCVDCADLSGASAKAIRGGAFPYPSTSLQASARDSTIPLSRNGSFGFRCARTP